MEAGSRPCRAPAPQSCSIVWIRVSGWKEGAWVDGHTVLEDFEVEVIAGGASRGPFEPERLADGHPGTLGGDERFEMPVDIRSPICDEGAVRP